VPSTSSLPAATRMRLWLAGRGAEARLAVRVAVAGVLALALGELLGLAQTYWAVFTTVIVMQASLGGSLQATFDRFVGTVGGGLFGAAIAMLLPRNDPAWIAVGLVAALLPLVFLAAIDPRFRVAPVTAVILLLSPTGQQVSPLTFTIDRILEIGLGSVVALAVSLVVLPARAHGLLAEATGRLLRELGEFLSLILGGLTGTVDHAGIRRLQVSSRRLLGKVEAAAAEARRERQSHLSDDPDPEPVVRTAMRLRNDMIIIARAAMEPLPAPFDTRLGPALSEVATAGGSFFRDLGVAFANRAAPPSREALQRAQRHYDGEMAAVREEGATRGLPSAAAARLFALGFALDQLQENLRDMSDRVAEFARPEPRKKAAP